MHTRGIAKLSRRLAALVLVAAVVPVYAAEQGKVRVRVKPPQAYVMVDGRAISGASWSGFHELYVVKMSPGEHTIGIYNYGYKPQTHKVTVVEHKTMALDVVLEAIPSPAPGPFGRIQIEGGGHSAVLLNGKTPDYLVGEADEFNNDFGWKQELLVPPGTHELTVLGGDRVVWSGPVTVEPGKRVIVNVKSGQQQATDWKGAKSGPLPRFKVGIASATVAVAPTTAQFSASPGQINCGESAKLTWSSAEAVESEISGIGKVPTSGEQTVQPKQSNTYTMMAAGPGGNVTPSATVNVNSAVQASLEVSPAEVSYQRVGSNVTEQGSTTVKWSTSNADNVIIEPFGKVDPSGSRAVQATTQQATPGPVNETTTYTLHASNACGGSETRTATLHIAGSIKPAVTETSFETLLASVYFPTAYPLKDAADVGLLSSQRQSLANFAEAFKKYLEVTPTARLRLEGNADKRGSEKYNLALSERRVEIVRQLLISQGIPPSAFETRALGLGNNLDADAVRQLEERNPNKPTIKMVGRHAKEDWLAHNRRVDIVLLPSGVNSARLYPYGAGDFKILWQAPRPARKVVEGAQ